MKNLQGVLIFLLVSLSAGYGSSQLEPKSSRLDRLRFILSHKMRIGVCGCRRKCSHTPVKENVGSKTTTQEPEKSSTMGSLVTNSEESSAAHLVDVSSSISEVSGSSLDALRDSSASQMKTDTLVTNQFPVSSDGHSPPPTSTETSTSELSAYFSGTVPSTHFSYLGPTANEPFTGPSSVDMASTRPTSTDATLTEPIANDVTLIGSPGSSTSSELPTGMTLTGPPSRNVTLRGPAATGITLTGSQATDISLTRPFTSSGSSINTTLTEKLANLSSTAPSNGGSSDGSMGNLLSTTPSRIISSTGSSDNLPSTIPSTHISFSGPSINAISTGPPLTDLSLTGSPSMTMTLTGLPTTDITSPGPLSSSGLPADVISTGTSTQGILTKALVSSGSSARVTFAGLPTNLSSLVPSTNFLSSGASARIIPTGLPANMSSSSSSSDPSSTGTLGNLPSTSTEISSTEASGNLLSTLPSTLMSSLQPSMGETLTRPLSTGGAITGPLSAVTPSINVTLTGPPSMAISLTGPSASSELSMDLTLMPSTPMDVTLTEQSATHTTKLGLAATNVSSSGSLVPSRSPIDITLTGPSANLSSHETSTYTSTSGLSVNTILTRPSANQSSTETSNGWLSTETMGNLPSTASSVEPPGDPPSVVSSIDISSAVTSSVNLTLTGSPAVAVTEPLASSELSTYSALTPSTPMDVTLTEQLATDATKAGLAATNVSFSGSLTSSGSPIDMPLTRPSVNISSNITSSYTSTSGLSANTIQTGPLANLSSIESSTETMGNLPSTSSSAEDPPSVVPSADISSTLRFNYSSSTFSSTTQSKSSTSGSQGLRSLRILAKGIMENSTSELSGMVSDAEDSLTKRSENATWKQMTDTAPQINVTFILKYKILIQSWMIDIQRLTYEDIYMIQSVIKTIHELRLEIQAGSLIIYDKSISSVKSTIKVTAIFLGYLSRAIEEENRQMTLSASYITVTQIDVVIGYIGGNLASLDSIVSQQSSFDSNSNISITIIFKIMNMIQLIIASGSGAMTQKMLWTLETYSFELMNLFEQVNSGLLLSYESVKYIKDVLFLVQSSRTVIDSSIMKITSKINAHNKVLLCRELVSATKVIKESIASIKAAQETAKESVTYTQYIISENFTNVFTLLQSSLEVLSDEHITVLKSFEMVATEIIEMYKTSKVDIAAFESFKLSNSELMRRASVTIAELSTRSSFFMAAEITYSVRYYITYIIQIVQEIQNKTLGASSTQNVTNISVIKSFLSSLAMESLTENHVAQLEMHSVYLRSVYQSLDSSIVAISGIQELLEVAYNSSRMIAERVVVMSEIEDQLITVERLEASIRIMTILEREILTLTTRISDPSYQGQSQISITAEIEVIIYQLLELIVKFSRKYYMITEADMIRIQTYYTKFITLSRSIHSFMEIRGLRKLAILIQTTKTVIIDKRKSLVNSFKAKESLDSLIFMHSFLIKLKSYILQLTDSQTSSSTVAYLMVAEMKKQLAFWNQGVQYIQRSAVDEMLGIFGTLQTLALPGSHISGINDLFDLIASVEVSIKEAERSALLADRNNQIIFMQRSAFNLILESMDSLDQLSELNELASGESITRTEVSYLMITIRRIIRKTSAITLVDISEFQQALAGLTQLIIAFEKGQVAGKVSGLTESLNEIVNAKMSFEKKMVTPTISKVEVLSAIMLIINDTMSLLENVAINESVENQTNYETVKSEAIDDFFKFLLKIQLQENLVTEEDLQYLIIIKLQIQNMVSSATEYSIFSGYSVSITTVIVTVKEIMYSISETIHKEEALAKENEKLYSLTNIFNILSDIVITLEIISKMEIGVCASSITEDFRIFSSILDNIPKDIASFTDSGSLVHVLESLYTIQECQTKLEGTNELLSSARSTLIIVERYIEELRAERAISFSIQQLVYVSRTTNNIVANLGRFVDKLNPELLLGESNIEIEETINWLDSLRINVDLITGDVLSEIIARFDHITSIIVASEHKGTGIGNFLALRKAMMRLAEVSDIRKREQMDRHTVIRQISGVQNRIHLLMSIKEILLIKIAVITSTKIMMTVPNSEAISNVSLIINRILKQSVFDVSETELNISFSALQNLNVNAGEEIPGIFSLQSMVERSVGIAQSEAQFLISTQEARKSLDILSSSTKLLTDTENQLQAMVNYYRSESSGGGKSFSFVLSDLLFLMGKLSRNEKLSYSITKRLETLLENLKSFNLQVKLDVNVILEALELTRTAIYATKQTLNYEKQVSENRLRAVLLEKSSFVISQTQEVLWLLYNGHSTNGEQLEDKDINHLFLLLEEMSNSSDISEGKINYLEEMKNKVSGMNSSVYVGKHISGINEVIQRANFLEMSINEKILSSRKSIELLSKKTMTTKIIRIFEQLSSTVTVFVSSADLRGTERKVIEVSDLREVIQNIDMDAISVDQIAALEERVKSFENISVEANTTIAGLSELKSIVLSKTEGTKQSTEVFSAINEISENRNSLLMLSTAFANLEDELYNITTTSDLDSNNETGFVSDLVRFTEVDIPGSIADNVKILEDVTEKLRFTKRKLTISSRSYLQIIKNIERSRGEISLKLMTVGFRYQRRLQFLLFTEMWSVLSFVSRITIKITSGSLISTEVNNETREILYKIITMLKRFKANVVDLKEEDLIYFRENVQLFTILLNKGIVVEELSQIAKLSAIVMESYTREIETIKIETRREQVIKMQSVQKSTLTYTLTVLKEISRKTMSSMTSYKEIKFLEIERILYIVSLIKEGLVQEQDMILLRGYTESLAASMFTFTFSVRVADLQETISLASKMEESVRKVLIIGFFDSSYSERVYELKLYKSLLIETSDILGSLAKTEGDGNGGKFSHGVLAEMFAAIERLETGYSRKTVSILSSQMEVLKAVTVNITNNTRVFGLHKLHRKTTSAMASLELSISRSYSLEYVSIQISNLEIGIELVTKIELITKKLSEKYDLASFTSSLYLKVINDTIYFLQSVEIYTLNEIVVLREYIGLLSTLEKGITNERIEGLDIVTRYVNIRKTALKKILAQKTQMLRSEKQYLYTSAARGIVRNAYDKLSGLRIHSANDDIEEVEHVTRFSLFLGSINILSVSAIEISELNTRMDSFFTAVSNTKVQNMAYISIIIEQLTYFMYVSDIQLQAKENYESERRIYISLKGNHVAIKETSSVLYSIKQRISMQNVTYYEENLLITELYNFLISFIYEFRQITNDFSWRLSSFNLSSVAVSRGAGIVYLKEVINLMDQFLFVEEQSYRSIQFYEAIAAVKELQTSVSLLVKTPELFICMADPEMKEGYLPTTPYFIYNSTTIPANTSSSIHSIDGSASNTQSFTEKFSTEQATDSSSPREKSSTSTKTPVEGNDDADSDGLFKMLEKIMNSIGKMSVNSNGFTDESSDATNLIRRFIETDLNLFFSKSSCQYIETELSRLNQYLVQITTFVNEMELNYQIEMRSAMIEETSKTLRSIEKSISIISESQKGPVTIHSTFSELKETLLSLTSVHVITRTELSTLQMYSYQLSAATASSNNITLDSSEISALISYTLRFVEFSYSSLASLVRVSKIGNSVPEGNADLSYFTAFSSISESAKAQHAYDSEEISVIREISQVSQHTYIQKEFLSLLTFALESLTINQNSSNAVTSTSGIFDATSGSANVYEELNEQEIGESELSYLLSQLSVFLRVAITSVDDIHFSSLTTFASYVNKIKSATISEQSLYLEEMQNVLSLITSAALSLSRYNESIHPYTLESQGFVNLQESSSLIDEFKEIWVQFDYDAANNTGLGELDISILSHSESITDFIMHYSLKSSSSISEETLYGFRESLRFIESRGSLRGFHPSYIQIWKSFLLTPIVTHYYDFRYMASKSYIVRSETQKELYLTRRAYAVVVKYFIVIRKFSGSFNGTSQFASHSRIRVMKIISDALQISKQWSGGTIKKYQIISYEKYLAELSQLLILLRGTEITEIAILEKSLSIVQQRMEVTLETVYRETTEDQFDARIDGQLELFSQINSFLRGRTFVTAMNSSEILHDSSREVSFLLQLFDSASGNIMAIDPGNIFSAFTSLVYSLRNNTSFYYTIEYMEISQMIQDAVELVEATRQSSIFERAKTTVSRLMSAIPFSYRIQAQNNRKTIYVEDIARLRNEVNIFKRNLYSVSRTTIRNFSRREYTLKEAIKIYGGGITYIFSIDDKLSQIQLLAEKYEMQAMMCYRYNRAIMTYVEATIDIMDAEKSIRQILASNKKQFGSGNKPNDIVEGGFYFFVNKTLDFIRLPKNLDVIIRDFNFGSLEITDGYSILYLKSIHRILKRIIATHDHYALVLRYMTSEIKILKIRELINIIVEKLEKVPRDYTSQDGTTVDLDLNLSSITSNINAVSTADYGESSSTIKSHMTSTSESSNSTTNNAGFGDSLLGADDILSKILNITDLFVMNGFNLEDSYIYELEYYGKIISSLSSTVLQGISDLSNVAKQLSEVSLYLNIAVDAFESATQVTESHNTLNDVVEMSNMLKVFIEEMPGNRGTAKMATLMNSIEQSYRTFIKGFTFISQEEVHSCLRLVYELTSLSIIEGEVIIDSSGLYSLVLETETRLVEANGFFSVHSFHYQQVMFRVGCSLDQGNITYFWDISSASQLSYMFYEIETILLKIVQRLGEFGVGKPGNDSSNVHAILWDITTILKTTENDVNSLQFRTLFELSRLSTALQSVNVNDDLFNEMYIKGITEFIQSRLGLFSVVSEAVGSYGRTCTNMLILQEAISVLKDATAKTWKWIYCETDPNCAASAVTATKQVLLTDRSKPDSDEILSATTPVSISSANITMTSNSGSTSNHTYSSLTTPASISSTDIQTTSSSGSTSNQAYSSTLNIQVSSSYGNVNNKTDTPQTTATSAAILSTTHTANTFTVGTQTHKATVLSTGIPLSNNNSMLFDARSFQDLFESASDALMFWTYDSSSVNFESLSEFKTLMKILDDSCHTVQGFHMWDQILISSNLTLTALLENVYHTKMLEKARAEEALFRYSNVLKAINSYLVIIRNTSESLDVNTSNNNYIQDSNLSADIKDGVTKSKQEIQGDAMKGIPSESNPEYYISMRIKQNMEHIISLSLQVLERWSENVKIKKNDIKELISHSLELASLFSAGGDITNSSGNLHRSLVDIGNYATKVMEELEFFMEESSTERSHVSNYNFFMQSKELLYFSISLIRILKDNNMNVSEEDTPTYNSSTENKTASVSSVNGNSTTSFLEINSTSNSPANVNISTNPLGSTSSSFFSISTSSSANLDENNSISPFAGNDNSTTSFLGNNSTSFSPTTQSAHSIGHGADEAQEECKRLLCSAKRLLSSLQLLRAFHTKNPTTTDNLQISLTRNYSLSNVTMSNISHITMSSQPSSTTDSQYGTSEMTPSATGESSSEIRSNDSKTTYTHTSLSTRDQLENETGSSKTMPSTSSENNSTREDNGSDDNTRISFTLPPTSDDNGTSTMISSTSRINGSTVDIGNSTIATAFEFTDDTVVQRPVLFMDAYRHEKFIYGEARSSIYAFIRAMRKIDSEKADIFDEVLNLLKVAEKLIGDQLYYMENHNVAVTADVSRYFQL